MGNNANPAERRGTGIMSGTMRLHGHIRHEVAKWPNIEWPIMSLETAKKLAEDIFRQYELCKGSNKCIVLMAVVDATENWEGLHFFFRSGAT